MKTGKILSLLAVVLLLASCNKNGVTNKPLKTEIDSVSYAVGYNMGEQVRTGFDKANIDSYLQGIKSGLDSANILIEKSKMQGVVKAYFQKKQMEDRKKQMEEAAKKAEETYADLKAAGEKLIADNISKEGVQTTESGLQYIVLKEGNGEKPTATSKVKVHYHGTLFDGTVFDSSVDRDTPFTFSLSGGVIKGWLEGVKLMSVGSKYKFFIPQELAYGHQKRSEQIQPFTPLIFEIELLEIVK